MPSQDTVTAPSGIGRSIQPADLVLQPGDIPTAFLRFHSHNGSIYFQNGDGDRQASRCVRRKRSRIHLRHPAGCESSQRDTETVDRGGRFLLFIVVIAITITPASSASTTIWRRAASTGTSGD